MKKFFLVLLAGIMCLGLFSACGGEKQIMVVSRENSSGTRSAFEELLGMKASELVSSALEFKDTAAVATTVENNKNAIGYISLGSLNDKVKALQIDGVKANIENIKNNTYALQRPFLLVTKTGSKTEQTQDFLKFIDSNEGQAVISGKGYIAKENGVSYDTAQNTISGKIKINGSTSVDPLMEKLMGEYTKKQSGVQFEKSATGSSAGITAAQEGTCDIGMSSREIKASETGLDKVEICRDGIVVIVNQANDISNLKKENLVKIYKGEIKLFSEIK